MRQERLLKISVALFRDTDTGSRLLGCRLLIGYTIDARLSGDVIDCVCLGSYRRFGVLSLQTHWLKNRCASFYVALMYLL